VDNSVDSGVQEIHILLGRSRRLARRLHLVLQVPRFHVLALRWTNFTEIVAMAPQVSQIKAFHRTHFRHVCIRQELNLLSRHPIPRFP
jgi:hypothetical protein